MQFFGLTIGRAKDAGAAVPVRTGSMFGIVREGFPGAWQRGVEVDSRETLLA